MADDGDVDDQWLYGEPEEQLQTNGDVLDPSDKAIVEEPTNETTTTAAEAVELEEDSNTVNTETILNDENNSDKPLNNQQEDAAVEEETAGISQQEQNGDEEDLEDDDSDDDVNVVIGDIKAATPSYTSLNIKRGGLLTSSGPADKNKIQQPGKFSVDEFDQAGMINGVPATEYNLDSLEDKPWRKPGADITDYFNYGFNEETWKAYCERQKRMRMSESGVGLAAQIRGSVPIMNDNSKYSGNFLGIRKAGPPPGRRMTGAIDVIGATSQHATPAPIPKVDQPKMNVIQVMTADRREYSRKPTGFPDMSVPPPSTFEEFQPEYGFNPEPEPFYGGYEPTQDSQWGTETGPPPPNWTPTDIKLLVPTGPNPLETPNLLNMGPPPLGLPMPMTSPRNEGSPPPPLSSQHREASKEPPERVRDSTSRAPSERPRDRERERSHRRERSRSRSRRHKSRSRSPSHRSHRKKKSRRHEESE